MTRTLTIVATIATLAAPAFAQGDAAIGEKEFSKCKNCHMIASADETLVKGGRSGPNLYGVIGRTAGTSDGFKYQADIVKAGEAGLVWDVENIARYMEDPRSFLREMLDDSSAKTGMTFRMRKNADDVAAYLATFSD